MSELRLPVAFFGKAAGLLLVGLSLLAGVSAARAADEGARIFVAGREVMLKPQPVIHDGEAYAPLDVLRTLGASYSYSKGDAKAEITAADGTVVETTVWKTRGTPMLAIGALADKLGAFPEWEENQRILHLRARVLNVKHADGVLLVNLGFPAAFTAKEFPNPRRVVVDISGAQQVGPSETHDFGAPELPLVKIGQFEPDTARVVLHLSEKARWKLESRPPSTVVRISLLPPPEPKQPAPKEQLPPKIAKITSIAVAADEDDHIELKMAGDAYLSPQSCFLTGPYRVCIDFPNAELASEVTAPVVLSKLVSDVSVGPLEEKRPTVRVVLELTRILAYSMIRNGPKEVSALVRIPDSAGGKLLDKSIVIDAGHGGHDPGARWGTALEKNLNLSIAKLAAERLRSLGAEVRLTREDDTYIALPDRPKVAEDAGADLFISIHCNSNGRPESASGTETYYHKQDPSSRALAQAVQMSVVEAARTPNRGAKSDMCLVSSGFAVLRNATVPAALLEIGFLNHSKDRSRLEDESFQKLVAEGIVKGLCRYVDDEESLREELANVAASPQP